ncbi:MAG TPA: glycoside hydrolase family 38 C-terminal domain-containing protein [Ktedonobacteraceae bacterium]|nr:glycoside hydrolase family 38 C-terminal domain-containing protein [Ktedonobacteraceae bacterium]
MGEQLRIILVPHTHWDREWYQTFQQFRMRLVHTVDMLLDILDRDSAFSHFMLDGQTILLDDYLEVQPQNEERLRQYVRAGRIQVGPWYVQPDEFLVSGESLIRNLQIGLRRAADFGKPMRIGYVPDCFGHIAQLPQILQGFGIESAVFWRGVGAEAHKSEFYWAAPDGSSVLVLHLADPLGYSNARVLPLSPAEFATRTELLASQILPKATTGTLLFMNGSDHLEPQNGLPATIEAANILLAHLSAAHEQILAQHSETRHYDSMHVEIGTLPQYLAAVQSYPREMPLQTLSGEMRSSQYAHLLPAVLSTRMWIKQQNTATEHLLERWLEPLTAWAARLGMPYPEGLVRLAWRYLLQNHPHDSICGCSIDQVHRENSVRFAQSQQIAEGVIAHAMHVIVAATNTCAPFAAPHKNGSPVPVVVFNAAPGPRTETVLVVMQLPGSLHNAVICDERGERMPFNVVNRWRQEVGSMSFPREMIATAVALADTKTPGALLDMAESTLAGAMGQTENPYSISRMHVDAAYAPGVARIELLIAQSTQKPVRDAELFAAEQEFLALVQREDIHTLEVMAADQTRETIEFVAADLPAYGLKTFWAYPRGLPEGATKEPFKPLNALATAPNSIENEWYHVEANAQDGTLTVTDKQSGAVFRGLNRFVDSGDVGDLYTYCPPQHDTCISQPSEAPEIEVIASGPVRATLHVSCRWSLPTSCSADRSERSGRMVSCSIVSEIVLVPGRHRIDIHTSIENKAKDHRIRVMFPTFYTVEDVAAEGTFEVRTRPVSLPRAADVLEWTEEPVNTFPQKRFVDISNGQVGLGILNRGLPEYEVVQNGPGPGIPPEGMAVAVTLLRCVEWLSRGDLSTRRGHAGPMEHTPEAQCLGTSVCDYALVPHAGDWEAAEALVMREAQAFNTPVRALVTDQHEGRQPSQATLLEVEPRELVVSAIKQSTTGNGLIVRVYNPLSHAVEASIRPAIDYAKAFVTNLAEEPQEQVFWSGEEHEGQLPGTPLYIGVGAGKIVTLLFQ